MATKEHSALTDADGIHEPKGFDSATAQQLIRVNAAGTDVEWVAQDVALTGAAGVDKQILVADGAGGVKSGFGAGKIRDGCTGRSGAACSSKAGCLGCAGR